MENGVKYIIIEVPITRGNGYFLSEFDKNKYMEEKKITLIGDPAHIDIKPGVLTLVFRGKEKERETSGGITAV